MIQLLATAPVVTEMAQKIAEIGPEILMIFAAFATMLNSLSSQEKLRSMSFGMALAAVGFAFILSALQLLSFMKDDVVGAQLMGSYARVGCTAVGFILLILTAELPWLVERNAMKLDKEFQVGKSISGEFYGFFLLSLAGAMLCASADDLVWMFLALELTSLPTYVMVAVMKDRNVAPEAGVKYFFLGAFSAAIFLYGFAMLYGATGTTKLSEMQAIFAQPDGMTTIALLGLAMSFIGISFKLAAVPMHAYTADVYQGAATPVTAFLAFTPKAAGLFSLILLLNVMGWPLALEGAIPEGMLMRSYAGDLMSGLIWIVAVATMLFGNCLALRQKNVKRILAYSSIAHSGYILVGLYVGPGDGVGLSNGLAAAIFYIMMYGLMNGAAFAVLGILERKGMEAETLDDIKGLVKRDARLGWLLVIAVFSLAGIPPLVGFLGKLFLFGAAISHGAYVLAVIGVLNSAIAAVYYLWIIAAAVMDEPEKDTKLGPYPIRYFGAVVAGFLVLVMTLVANPIIQVARQATLFPSMNGAASSVEATDDEAETTPAPAAMEVKKEDTVQAGSPF